MPPIKTLFLLSPGSYASLAQHWSSTGIKAQPSWEWEQSGKLPPHCLLLPLRFQPIPRPWATAE